jgi:hypothetical protein
MTEIREAAEQPGGSLDAVRAEYDELRAEYGELRRQVAVNDQEIDLLQVEAAKYKRVWYRDPTVLVATFALVVSVSTFLVGQFNVNSDRRIEDRNRLSALIEQLPTARQQATQPGAFIDLMYLVAENALTLIDRLGPEASTAADKIEVAFALETGDDSDLPSAKRLAITAEQQSNLVREKVAAELIIVHVDFLGNDAAGGRDAYRRALRLNQTPLPELDSLVLRTGTMISIELRWIADELFGANSCAKASEQLKNAMQLIGKIPPNRVNPVLRTGLDNSAKTVTEQCPTTVR